MKNLWSPSIRSLTPYVPGEQPRVARLIKLNTNENPYPPSPLVLAALQDASGSSLRLYPDPDATELKEAIAAYYGLRPIPLHTSFFSFENNGLGKNFVRASGYQTASAPAKST